MASIYGVVNGQTGEHIDVSRSERGAKNHATRNGYKHVSRRGEHGMHVEVIAVKENGKWVTPETQPEFPS